MIIYRDKLYQGKFVDLRSYEVEKALKKREPIVVIHKGQKMVLTPEYLRKNKMLLNKDPIPSKVNVGQFYYLYSYSFIPEKNLSEDKKMELFSKTYL